MITKKTQMQNILRRLFMKWKKKVRFSREMTCGPKRDIFDHCLDKVLACRGRVGVGDRY